MTQINISIYVFVFGKLLRSVAIRKRPAKTNIMYTGNVTLYESNTTLHWWFSQFIMYDDLIKLFKISIEKKKKCYLQITK